MVRAQRILAGIELFSLALWAGGLFFLLFIALPGLNASFPDDPAVASKLVSAWLTRFGPLEVILGVAILISNVVKLAAFPSTGELQRGAVLAATLLLVISIACQVSVRPKLEEMHSDLQKSAQIVQTSELPNMLLLLEKKHMTLVRADLLFCLFLLYCFRVFEERKMRAIFNIMNSKQQ